MQDYPLIREGRIFVPASTAHAGSSIQIDLHLPGLDETYVISGRVTVSTDAATAKAEHRPAGIWVDFSENAARTLVQMETALRADEDYRNRLHLPPPEAAAVRPPPVKPKAKDQPKPAPVTPAKPDRPAPAARAGPSRASSPSRPAKPEPKPAKPSAAAAPAPSAPPEAAAVPEPEPKWSKPAPAPQPAPSKATAAPEPEPKRSKPAPAPQPARPRAPAPSAHDRDHPIALGAEDDFDEQDLEAAALDPEKRGPGEEDIVVDEESEAPTASFTPVAEGPAPQASADHLRRKLAEIEQESVAPTPIKPTPGVDQGRTNVEVGWLKDMLTQGEMPEPEAELPPEKPGLQEKIDLTPQERERLEPVGLFIMDLVKAMARSAYYDPNHPASQSARVGLYEEFKAALLDSPEIMITHMLTKERSDLLMSGVFEGQISVRTVVGAGMAEMFIPKLKDYFDRKGLLSIALKHDISEEAFGAFITIMSDPRADRGTAGNEAGAILTKMLADSGITDVSAVFIDDVIALEDKVTWRVQMAINRLAKDLRVLPMFKNMNAREMKRMKIRIVQDIIRPLRVPVLLKEIIVNCYVIAKHIDGLDEEDLESSVIASFPFAMLLTTSRLIFDDLHKLREQQKDHPDVGAIQRRLRGTTRIIRMIASRVIEEKAPGARDFLEGLYYSEILAFHELPPQVQFLVNTMRLTNDVKSMLEGYAQAVETVGNAEDARVFIDCFSRITPTMIEKKEWATMLALARALFRGAAGNPIYRDADDDLRDPLGIVYRGLNDDLVAAYEQLEGENLAAANEIMALLGPLGIEIMVKVLAISEARAVRKNAVDALVKIGAPVRERVRKLLDDPNQFWFLHRNAILIIGMIGEGEDDHKRVRRFLRHSHARLREEALGAVARFEGKAAETALAAALTDSDRRILRRALAGLNQIQPVSEATVRAMLGLIKHDPPKEREPAKEHEERTALIIRGLGAMPDPPLVDEIESAFLALGTQRWKSKTSIFKKLRGTMEEADDPVVLLAAVEALGKLGGPKSLKLLEAVAKDDASLGQKAREALNRLQLRTGN